MPIISPALLEYIDEPSDIGIRWSLPGGLQRATVTVSTRNKAESLQRYQEHHGQRMMIVDNTQRPICIGWIYEIKLTNTGVQYIVGGAWKRHRQLLNATIYDTADTTADVLEDTLTNFVEVVDETNFTNIDPDTLTPIIDGWQPNLRGGRYSDDIIKDLIAMGDSTGAQWDYWLEPFARGTLVEKHIAHFEQRTSGGSPDWVVNTDDLASLDVSTNIWNLTTDIEVYYGFIDGTASGAGTVSTLTDATATFIDDGVQEGDSIYNVTNGEKARVILVTQTTIMSADFTTPWAMSDKYAIKMANAQVPITKTSTPAFWKVEQIDKQTRLSSAQADNFADETIERFSKAVQQQSFVVTSPFIRNAGGACLPLWDVIKNGGGYIAIRDLDPTFSSLSDRSNTFSAFRIIAVDFEYASNRLRISLDNEDGRLDVLLKKAGIVNGEIISTAR